MTSLVDIQRHLRIPTDGKIGPVTLNAISKALGMTSPIKVTSLAGLTLIKAVEGLRLKAYQDTGGVWTIGYGHTKGVKSGDIITEVVAENYLHNDLHDAEEAVSRLFNSTTQNQFDALVSFTFNLGEGRVSKSTLRTKHNAGDFTGATNEFKRWVYDNGVQLAGLVKRRTAEAALYRS